MKKKLFRRIALVLALVLFFTFSESAYAAHYTGLSRKISSKIFRGWIPYYSAYTWPGISAGQDQSVERSDDTQQNTDAAPEQDAEAEQSDDTPQNTDTTPEQNAEAEQSDDTPQNTDTTPEQNAEAEQSNDAERDEAATSETSAESETGASEESDVQNPDADGWYTIDNDAFGISSDGQNARATTDGINTALDWASGNGYNKVRLADGTYMIQCKWQNRYIAPTDGILVPSNMSVDLGNAVLKIEPNSYVCSSIISVVDQSNVTITGGTLIGDRGEHTYSYSADSGTHEWGFGVLVSASSNVVVNGVTIRDTTGDGVILTGSYRPISSGGRICSNVSVLNCDISSCRRQGISVIGATDSVIAGNTIYNINGTAPQYGIDVEPEADYRVDNLKIYNNTIYGCTGGAINCNKGSNYEVYNNDCIGNKIIAVRCTNVSIYNNTITNSQIRVMNYSSNVTVTDNTLDSASWIFFG